MGVRHKGPGVAQTGVRTRGGNALELDARGRKREVGQDSGRGEDIVVGEAALDISVGGVIILRTNEY